MVRVTACQIVGMMDSLQMEKKFAAEVFSFLDADDSGDITWQEFVRGVSDAQFSVRFPQITLEALVALPSSLARDRYPDSRMIRPTCGSPSADCIR